MSAFVTWWIRLLLLVIVSGMVATKSTAEYVSFQYEAVVDQISPSLLLPVGTRIYGSYTFNLDTPAAPFGPNQWTVYEADLRLNFEQPSGGTAAVSYRLSSLTVTESSTFLLSSFGVAGVSLVGRRFRSRSRR